MSSETELDQLQQQLARVELQLEELGAEAEQLKPFLTTADLNSSPWQQMAAIRQEFVELRKEKNLLLSQRQSGFTVAPRLDQKLDQKLAPEASAAAKDSTAAFLRQLLPRLQEDVPMSDLRVYLEKGLPLRLPVADALYRELTLADSELEDLLQPVSACGAEKLSIVISAALGSVVAVPDDEVCVAGLVDKHVFDVWDIMARTLHTHSLKRKRHCGESSLTAAGLRPDVIMLVMDSLLFKGEDKASTDGMTKAILELAQKLKDWSVVYHNNMEFLLCYAAAGTDLQFCALERSLGPGTVHRLGPQLNLQDKYQQVLAITTAIKLFPILLAQAEQLPKNVKLGKTKKCANGTEIFYGDTFVQKIVPLSKQPELAGKQQLMSEVYQAVKGCDQLVQLQTGTHVSDRGDYYRVTLKPLGIELQSSNPPAGAELRAAIRCVLQALQWLHRCGYGHGDVRWENVVQLTAEAFCLIDLEAVVRLGSKPQGPEELMPGAWGHAREALDQGVFTARSDLYMVGGLMKCVRDLDSNGFKLMTRLKQKSITVEAALQHTWLQRAGSTGGGCT